MISLPFFLSFNLSLFSFFLSLLLPLSISYPLQVSTSSEHQEFFVFLQRLLSPVLEAYSGAAILVHSLKQPVDEREYTQQLFRYLLTRTERGVAAYGKPHSLIGSKRVERRRTTLGLVQR